MAAKCTNKKPDLVEIVHSSVKNKVERDVEKAIAFTEHEEEVICG